MIEKQVVRFWFWFFFSEVFPGIVGKLKQKNIRPLATFYLVLKKKHLGFFVS